MSAAAVVLGSSSSSSSSASASEATGAERQKIEGFARPETVVVSGDTLFATDAAHGVVAYDLKKATFKAACDFVKAGYNATEQLSNGFFVHEHSNTLFLADVFQGHVYACDLKTHEARLEFKHDHSVNDVFVDSRGRVWFTVSAPVNGAADFFGAFAKPAASGELWLYEPRAKSRRRIASGFIFANGLYVDEEEETVYVAESTGNRISKLKVTLFDGTALGGATTHAFLPSPDVIQVHRESGYLIVGSVATNRIYRVSLHEGGETREIFSFGDTEYSQAFENGVPLGKNLVEALAGLPAFAYATSGAFLVGKHHLYVGGFGDFVTLVRI